MYAVAPTLFSRLAGTVSRRQNRGHILVVGRNRDYADARTESKYPVFPRESKVSHALAQSLSRAHGFIERAALQQNAEFIAAQA